MSKYILKKEDRTVTLSKNDSGWNYRKEFGTTLMDNFNFTEDKLNGFLKELTDIGYELTQKPSWISVQLKTPYIECGVIISEDGTKKYYNGNNELHNENGPAIEWANGNKEWYFEGKRHRDNGPAIEDVNGNHSWYDHGNLIAYIIPKKFVRNQILVFK